MEIDSPLKQIGQKAPPTFLRKDGIITQLRPDVDVVLSLKNPTYKAKMLSYFQKLGGKKKNADRNSNDEEKKVAKEVLTSFKTRKKGELVVRFFKPELRYSSRCFTEIDDKYALEKIMADIYRRMESASGANGWMGNQTEHEDVTNRKSSPPQYPGSVPPLAANNPTAKKIKRRKLKKVPQSLPFLSNTIITDIIVEEELQAKKILDGATLSRNDQTWHPDEVINFFRGLYVHGWEDWKKISKMVKTRSNQQIKSYALKLEKKFPELANLFSSKKVRKMQEKHSVKVKRYGSVATFFDGMVKNDPAMIAASVMEQMKQQAPPKPKVMICLGEHVIDTEAEPSLIQRFADRKQSAQTLPDEFDPSVRPLVPTSNQQVFIPGNKVYARWLNKGDPASYGTWYPGLIFGSKIAPIQDKYNYTGVPNLLYHVKFDDGAESLDLDTEDIIMWNHYELWLKGLEQYYSLSRTVSNEIIQKRLIKHTKVYAKWDDPTDPELHGSWMPGEVHSSKKVEGNPKQRQRSYHILFDNGDQDVEMLNADVIEEDTYKQLLRKKLERGKKRKHLSGFDLITAASKMTSPIKPGYSPPQNGTSTSVSAKRKLYSDDVGPFDGNVLVEDLRCTEKLKSKSPSPSHVSCISSATSPDVHYGIYMKATPWEFSNTKSSVQKEQPKSFTYAISHDPSDFQEYHRNKFHQALPADITSAAYPNQGLAASTREHVPVQSQADGSPLLLRETNNQPETSRHSFDSKDVLVASGGKLVQSGAGGSPALLGETNNQAKTTQEVSDSKDVPVALVVKPVQSGAGGSSVHFGETNNPPQSSPDSKGVPVA